MAMKTADGSAVGAVIVKTNWRHKKFGHKKFEA